MASLIFSHRFQKGNRKGTDLTWLLRYNHLTACHLKRCFDRFPDRLFLLRLASVCLPLAFPPTLYFYIIAVQNNSAAPLIPHISEDVRADVSEPPSPCRPDLSSATFEKHDLKCQLVPATLWGVTVMSSVSAAAGIAGRVRSRRTQIKHCTVSSRTDRRSIYRTRMAATLLTCVLGCWWGKGGVGGVCAPRR